MTDVYVVYEQDDIGYIKLLHAFTKEETAKEFCDKRKRRILSYYYKKMEIKEKEDEN